ncbi:hypothetical protein QTO34_009705 [Cnephaeus nilssonii]|uniref:Uncharacterized protein n=1 Tax=Cnephaeus nilssonii TaxID=3371016 RepID=A0AA40HJ66_CNENI|nr:hypothetical protein QTO34_009705 [Eptesicus nilssonii]
MTDLSVTESSSGEQPKNHLDLVLTGKKLISGSFLWAPLRSLEGWTRRYFRDQIPAHDVAATALLIKEADKLTLGQELALTTPHAVEALFRGAPERWMSNTRITQCQAFLLDQPRNRFHKTLAINPASLLPDDDPEEPIHDCIE